MAKVRCSECNTEFECPKDKINSKKFICKDCFGTKDIHFDSEEEINSTYVDIPPDKMSEIGKQAMMHYITEELFPKYWDKNKMEINKLSKKDIAKETFIAGAMATLDMIREMEERK